MRDALALSAAMREVASLVCAIAFRTHHAGMVELLVGERLIRAERHTRAGAMSPVNAATAGHGARRRAIPLMLTGSVAAAYHGAGRATMDVDLVIDHRQAIGGVRRASRRTGCTFRGRPHEALIVRTMFNVVDHDWKGDLIILGHSVSRSSRRQRTELLGSARCGVAEDAILSKLEWARLGGSQRQLTMRALVRLAGATLDRAYVQHWVEALGLEAQWRVADAR
jgi:hypothetical protein